MPRLPNEYICCYDKLAQDILIDPVDKSYPIRFKDLNRFISQTTDLSDKDVLDVGSSQGLYLKTIRAKSKVAFDLSRVFLQECPREYNPTRGNSEHLPFKDKSFDIIVCSDILEHVLEPRAMIKELARTLRYNGRLFVVIPWEEDISVYEQFKGKYDYCHVRSFDIGNISLLLNSENLIITRMCGSIPRITIPHVPYYLYNFIYPAVNTVNIYLHKQLVPYVHMMLEVRHR